MRLEGVIQEVEEIDKWLNRQENPPKIIKDETINKSSHADHYLGRPVEYVGIANRVTIYSPLINDKREYKSIEIFSGKDISDTLGMKFVDSFSRTEILHGKVMRLSL